MKTRTDGCGSPQKSTLGLRILSQSWSRLVWPLQTPAARDSRVIHRRLPLARDTIINFIHSFIIHSLAHSFIHSLIPSPFQETFPEHLLCPERLLRGRAEMKVPAFLTASSAWGQCKGSCGEKVRFKNSILKVRLMLSCCPRFARATSPSWALNVFHADSTGLRRRCRTPLGFNFLSCRLDWSTLRAQMPAS